MAYLMYFYPEYFTQGCLVRYSLTLIREQFIKTTKKKVFCFFLKNINSVKLTNKFRPDILRDVPMYDGFAILKHTQV